jgi:hypothetical protein
MSATASNWAVVWIFHTPGRSEERSFYSSRELALDAACDAPPQYQTALRIEGPSGVIIEQAAIVEHCSRRRSSPWHP